MRHIVTFTPVTALLLASVQVACAAGRPAPAQWTFLVYMDGDNNLEGYAIGDTLEMEAVGSSADVNLVIQRDLWSSGDSRRLYVNKGSSTVVQELGEVNMGDGATLQAFVQWAITTYPAQRYALVLWDHGGGWRGPVGRPPATKAVCWDDTNGGDALYTAEQAAAIEGALTATGANLELLGYDVCLAGMMEIIHEMSSAGLSGRVAAMAASPPNEPGDGWPYDTILADLVATPGMDGVGLGDRVVTRYAAYYGSGVGMSCYDLTQAGAASAAVDALAGALIGADEKAVTTAGRLAALEYHSDFRDLRQFVRYMKTHSSDAATVSAATTADTALNALVHSAFCAGSYAGGLGLSVYFPPGDYMDSDYNGSVIRWAAETRWDEFLGSGPAATEDIYEVDDTPALAKPITTDGALQHRNNASVTHKPDWVYFDAVAGRSYTIQTSNLGTQADTYLYLYRDPAASPLASDDDGGGGLASRIHWVCPATARYYVLEMPFSDSRETGKPTGRTGAGATYDLSVTALAVSMEDFYEPDNRPAEAKQIVVDAAPQQRINNNIWYKLDWAWFTATAGVSYVIATGNLGTNADTVLELYSDPAAVPLAENDDNGDLSSCIRWTCPASGTYYVLEHPWSDLRGTGKAGAPAERIGAAATYQLSITTGEDPYEADDTWGAAKDIIPDAGAQQRNNRTVTHAADWALLPAYRGVTYTIQTRNLGKNADTELFLFRDPQASPVAYDDNSGGGFASLITWTCPASGSYYVLERPKSTARTGEDAGYDLTVTTDQMPGEDAYEVDDSPGLAGLVPTTGAAQHRNHYSSVHAVDWSCFDATVGRTYVIRTTALGTEADTYLTLYRDPEGVPLADSDDFGGDLGSAIIWTCPQTGRYWVSEMPAYVPTAGRSAPGPALASTLERYGIVKAKSVSRQVGPDATYDLSVGPPGLSAPAGLTATVTAPDQVTLMWQDTSSGESGFEIQLRDPESALLAQWWSLYSVPAGITSTSVSGLWPGATVAFRVVAYSATRCSGPSNAVLVGMPGASPVSLVPGLAATGDPCAAGRAAMITVDASVGDATEVERYVVYRQHATQDWAAVADIPATGFLAYHVYDAGLMGGPYQYAVRAFNGWTDGSSVVLGDLQPARAGTGTAPRVPGLSASIVNVPEPRLRRTEVNLRIWPSPDDPANCTHYVLYRQEGSGSWQEVMRVEARGATGYWYRDRLASEPTTACRYAVRAINGTVPGDLVVATALSASPTVTPRPPSLVATRVPGYTVANLLIGRSPDDPDACTRYTVLRLPLDPQETWVEVGRMAADGSPQYTFTDRGISATRRYQYGVRAENGSRVGTLVTAPLRTLDLSMGDPRPPSITARRSVSRANEADITLDASPDDPAGVIQYQLWKLAMDPGARWVPVATIPATGLRQYRFHDVGLADRAYRYGVRAQYGPRQCALITCPVAGQGDPSITPRAPSLAAGYVPLTGNRQADVTLVASADDPAGCSHYLLYRRLRDSTGPWTALGTIPATGAAAYIHRDTGLAPGVAYRYGARAMNRGLSSPLVTCDLGGSASAGAALVTAAATATPGGGAQIVVSLAAEARLSIEVTNLAGRVVRRVCSDEAVSAGRRVILWDGRSATGTRVPSGRYLVRIVAHSEAGSRQQVLAAVLLRR